MGETVPFLNFLQTIGVLATLIFVHTSMLGMGFSLMVPRYLPRCIMKVCNSLAGGRKIVGVKVETFYYFLCFDRLRSIDSEIDGKV
jgi:hypothetical protein